MVLKLSGRWEVRLINTWAVEGSISGRWGVKNGGCLVVDAPVTHLYNHILSIVSNLREGNIQLKCFINPTERSLFMINSYYVCWIHSDIGSFD